MKPSQWALFIAVATLNVRAYLALENKIRSSEEEGSRQHEESGLYNSVQQFHFPLDYEIVYPFITDENGRLVALINHKEEDDAGFHDNGSAPSGKRRTKRHSPKSSTILVSLRHHQETFVLKLHRNRKLAARGAKTEWLQNYNNVKQEVISNDCYYVGKIQKQRRSSVAINMCNGMTGYIQTRNEALFIEPLDGSRLSFSAHVLYPVTSSLNRSALSLADDEFREDSSIQKRSVERPANTTKRRSKQKYMAVAVAADYSVVGFHGKKIEQFLLIIMNIVNAIYSDPSLGAKLHVVVTHITLLKDEKESKISQGNSRVSLENVCSWFKELNTQQPTSMRHDVGVYLTRQDIGGPAGYAPVGGMCNYRRSCALIRDEGLTSAFIIAHEVGHVLGFSHDGDEEEGNKCSHDGSDGSIMAPLVLATFTRFHWSKCTSQEYRNKINKWFCLNDKPTAPPTLPSFQSPLGREYSLDEQCRMEFGDGFQLCRSFLLSDPCTHLWCSNKSAPLQCKTKKGPPLEGTPCGSGKWCAQGVCQLINRKKVLWDPVQHNPQHGGWSRWSPFGDCSRTCGGGVRFRTRRCNKPKPAYGGRQCVGQREEFTVCNKQACPQLSDFRAEQCLNLPRLVRMEGRRSRQTWLPYPTMSESMQCKLTCIAKRTNEVFISSENVMDGTSCSYDYPHHICVQGNCKAMGCDKILLSNKTEDACGVCGGNGSNCKSLQKVYVRTPTNLNKLARVTVIPRGARHVEVKEVSKTPNYLVLNSRRFGESLLNKRDISAAMRTFVWLGTKFVYSRSNDSETITARGPTLDEVIVMAKYPTPAPPHKRCDISTSNYQPFQENKHLGADSAKILPVISGLHTMVTVNYTISVRKELDPALPKEEFYVWKVIGWSRCSRACGGGEQYSKAVCQDRRSDAVVGRRLCSLMAKPSMKRRMCNTFSCTYRWQPGLWEYCTHTCGSQGVQQRPVECVPVNETQTIVSPDLCRDGKPEEKRPCNRIPCQSIWFTGEWSPCSATCGHGVQVRNVTCIPPENEVLYDCGEKPEHIRECFNSHCSEFDDCEEDASEFCQLQVLQRYCEIPSFRKLCCQGCSNYLRF